MDKFTGLEFFHGRTSFNFMGQRRAATIASALMIVASLILMIPGVRGLNFGIDFTGGVLIEAGYPGPADLAQIRERLSGSGFGDAQVQNFGSASAVLIRVLPRAGEKNEQVAEEILAVLREGGQSVELRRTEFVGPQVGEELTQQGTLAMLLAMGMIFVYIIIRYQWKFAVGAIVATLHDPIVTLGFFAATRLPFDLSTLAAVLAVIGYSVNDTVVIFDRIRENFRKIRRGTPEALMNQSINETLSRSIITHGVTTLVVLAMLLFGGEALRGFSVALIVGIVVGTYSSIYIASATALALNAAPVDLIPPKVEKGEADALP